MMLICRAAPRLEEIWMKSEATLLSSVRFFSAAHWPTMPWPRAIVSMNFTSPPEA